MYCTKLYSSVEEAVGVLVLANGVPQAWVAHRLAHPP